MGKPEPTTSEITFYGGQTTLTFKRLREAYDSNSLPVALLDRLEAAEAQLADAKEFSEWQPIETPPKKAGMYLCCFHNGVRQVLYGEPNKWFHPFNVTHWMPLPEPPQEGE